MATTPVGAHRTVQSGHLVNPILAGLMCAAVVALAMGSLWIGLSGLISPDHAGGLLRTVGGFAGFYIIFALTLAAAVRQK